MPQTLVQKAHLLTARSLPNWGTLCNAKWTSVHGVSTCHIRFFSNARATVWTCRKHHRFSQTVCIKWLKQASLARQKISWKSLSMSRMRLYSGKHRVLWWWWVRTVAKENKVWRRSGQCKPATGQLASHGAPNLESERPGRSDLEPLK